MNGIHWTRVIAAAILSEVGVFIALFTSFGVAMLLTGISSDAIFNSTGEDISYYVAPPAAFVMTTLAALWATRPLMSGIVRHGVLIGLVAVLLTFVFIFGARPEHRLMYIVSFCLRIAGGYVGGLIGQRRLATRSNPAPAHAA